MCRRWRKPRRPKTREREVERAQQAATMGERSGDAWGGSLAAIRAAGFPGYSRGHFGHGLGAGLGSEEWPFISARSDVVLEPGMVMAFECPWYIDGLGGMIIENQLLITETGHEMMNDLPLDLVRIPA